MIKENHLLSQLTVADLKQLIEELQSKKSDEAVKPTGRLVYGLRGIQGLFNCSHKTAQYYKDHVINEAVIQNGRKIVVDADLALQLFKERRSDGQ